MTRDDWAAAFDHAEPARPPEVPGELAEGAVAEAFARNNADRLRFDAETGRWRVWDGARWQLEESGAVFFDCARLAEVASQGATARQRSAVWSSRFAAGVERLARADPLLRVNGAVWDADPWLLGTPGGTVDLRTGELRPADPGDGITRLAAVAPDAAARAPHWTRFLEEATGEDDGLARWLQAFAGYCLTGLVREHVFAFLWGPGSNGKSVFAGALAHVLGDYATVADMAAFTSAGHDRHPTELAALRGARLVTASETGEARSWDEARVKALTGGDPITARVMRGDPFTFLPTFKIMILGNSRPALRCVDDAIRRRIRLVPFVAKPREPDPELPERLREEAPAILAWAIRGCLDWREMGLWSPPAILDASAEYLEDQDVRAAWMAERCDRGFGPSHWTPAAELFASWREFAEARGERPGSATRLGNTLRSWGLAAEKRSQNGRNVRGWLGVRLRT